MAKETNPNEQQQYANPKWVEQVTRSMDQLATTIQSHLPPASVKEKDITQDRPQLTTPEEAKVYDDALERDFYKLDEKGRVTDVENLYKVVHIYPEFQTANSNEFIACFVIEQWKYVPDPSSGGKRRQVVTSFNVKAREFMSKYKPTLLDVAQLPA